MPTQVNISDSRFKFPDGCNIEIKATPNSDWESIGVQQGDTVATFNYDVTEFDTANAGKTKSQYKNQRVDGTFNLLNFNYKVLANLGNNLMSYSESAGGSITTIDNLAIDFTYSQDVLNVFPLPVKVDGIEKTVTAKTVASVTGGTIGALTEGTDFVITDKGIAFLDSATISSIGVDTLETFTVVFSSATLLASETLTGGSSTTIAEPYQMRATHTDSDGTIERLTLHSAVSQSGSFNFGFNGADTDALNVNNVSFSASIDSALPDGQQLFILERILP